MDAKVPVVACDRLEPDEFYMVGANGQVLTIRDGKAVELTGTERERVLRWKLRKDR